MALQYSPIGGGLRRQPLNLAAWALVLLLCPFAKSFGQATRLLRQPTLSATHIAYTYGGDLWVTELGSQKTTRLTSTAAVESNPHFSPDGKWIAFSSNRSGSHAVYVIGVEGGTPRQLTWHPAPALARGWTPDGQRVLYASTRDAAPANFDRLWTVAVNGGPSALLVNQHATNGSYSPDGSQLATEQVKRWDQEWRGYRGGQNMPLSIIRLSDLKETLLPNKSTFDMLPVWLGSYIYYLSDADGISNIWSYNPQTNVVKQITTFTGADIKWLCGYGTRLAYEREGNLYLFDLAASQATALSITIKGDFPWADTHWEDVTKSVVDASLSPTGKRLIIEARGEIFTVPAENGDTRNLSQTSGAADRAPLWSPLGNTVAWFSDVSGKGYELLVAAQDGLSKPKHISMGDAKMAWEPTWSPDGKFIAFNDNQVRIVIVELETGKIQTADVGGVNIERGGMGLTWSPDSQWLAYAKTGTNNFRQIKIWSARANNVHALTNSFADSFSPVWDRDGHHLYFLASTDLALGSGWANTSAMSSDASYSAYVVNLRKDDLSPFKPKSDEEQMKDEKKPEPEAKKTGDKPTKKDGDKDVKETKTPDPVVIDWDDVERRTVALPMPKANYRLAIAGPAGSVFIGEQKLGARDLTLQKFVLEKREVKEFLGGVNQVSVSADGNKMLVKTGDWKIYNTAGGTGGEAQSVKMNPKIKLDRQAEWTQMFNEAWRYERDYFYDPNLHGRNWDEVYQRYLPLVPFIKHRTDLTYVLDQVNGELSVGHSFVFGGDFPDVEKQSVGLLGADLTADRDHWKITRIYTTESWNPELSSPLDRPGIKIQEGYYLVGVNGKPLTAADDPYQFMDGTLDVQTVIHINKEPSFEGAWQETVKPIRSEFDLRQRAWVEDNRKTVDRLSNGKLAYVWVPNTSSNGFISFNRYFFAQQDKQGAVIDERYNGGGLLDDYMVDLMNRKLRAAVTNEAPGGKHFRLPAGILGPKVLLINELAGSGGDFFPWVFRQQKTGPLIGQRTWGGLVKSSVHYALVDGGALTAPDNAVFDPINHKWIAENEGVAPDIDVRQDAVSLSKGIDPQLERGVKEALRLLEQQGEIQIVHPPYSTPAKKQ